MNELIRLGRIRTILISISVLLVSLHTIYFYHVLVPESDERDFLKQVIRFVLTILLLLGCYYGKGWVRKTAVVLFLLAIIVALVAIGISEGHWVNKTPLGVMIFVYAVASYHFGLSDSYNAFFDYQKKKGTESELYE